MIEFKAPIRPDKYADFTLFLAGSIEMGKAINWQKEVVAALADVEGQVFNPLREEWDSSWTQSIDNPQFNEQVTWELDHIELCNKVLFNFIGDTKSPITLMELGLRASLQPIFKTLSDHHLSWAAQNILVICPNNFWRKGNVDIVCKRYNIPVIEKFDLDFIKDWVNERY